ncbi:MAG: sugar transferase [Candidatus Ruminococcus intestinipullorum]|nr:sugar transferase [Candidatus Ruminococcus intestinipullorum]
MWKKWEDLPADMQQEEVRKYYLIISQKRIALCAKRFCDIILSILLMIPLLPIMLVIAVCIKLDSTGPIFYRQERVTQYGRVYRIFKFRTMVTDADKKGPLVTTGRDPRITRMGEKLRKCRLDELPQLFNVLKGDMSFVGTRPEVKKYVECYSPEMLATLLLPAGVTSRASIAYKDEDAILEKYSNTTDKTADEIYVEYILPEKMKYNLKSLETFSLWGDFRVMIDTFFSVMK